MYKNILCGIFFFLTNSYYVSADHWITVDQSSMGRNLNDNVSEVSNDTDLSTETMDVSNTTENDLFWTTVERNDTIEADSEIQVDNNKEAEEANNTFQTEENEAQVATNESYSEGSTNLFQAIETDQKPKENGDKDASQNELEYEIDEKIVLQRTNCQLEIAVEETHDLKLFIKFGKLENNTSGRCCITLNGSKKSVLGVLISNVHLYQHEFEGEILKVITADYGTDFVLKEYYSWTKYEPMLLTDAHKVYLVLYYKTTIVPPSVQESHFHLEVISYNSYKSQDNDHSYYTYDYNVPKLPKPEPLFAPYFY